MTTDSSEPQTYINIPVTESEAASIRDADKFWTGPKLVVLTAVTLGFAFLILYINSQHMLISMPNEVREFAPGALTGH